MKGILGVECRALCEHQTRLIWGRGGGQYEATVVAVPAMAMTLPPPSMLGKELLPFLLWREEGQEEPGLAFKVKNRGFIQCSHS